MPDFIHPFFAKKKKPRLLTESSACSLIKCGKEPAPWPVLHQMEVITRDKCAIEAVEGSRGEKVVDAVAMIDYFLLQDKRRCKESDGRVSVIEERVSEQYTTTTTSTEPFTSTIQNSTPQSTLPITTPQYIPTPTSNHLSPSQLLALQTIQSLVTSDASDESALFLLHGPSGSGKSFLAERVLPTALHRRLLLLHPSSPRTPKSLHLLSQHLSHSHPRDSLLVIDAVECLFSVAEERTFPQALGQFLAGKRSGLVIVMTSEWTSEEISRWVGLKLSGVVSVGLGSDGDGVGWDSGDGLDRMRLDRRLGRCDGWDSRLDSSSRYTLDTHPSTSTYPSPSPYPSYPFAPLEDHQLLDEMLWSHQLPDLGPLPSISSSPSKRLHRRFFEYGRSLNRLAVWEGCLLEHVLEMERYWGGQEASLRRGRRRVAHYKYIIDEKTLKEILFCESE